VIEVYLMLMRTDGGVVYVVDLGHGLYIPLFLFFLWHIKC